MSEYRAHLIEDAHLFALGNSVRLLLRKRDGIDRAAYLMADGTWVSVAEGASLPEQPAVGFVLPAESLEAVVEGIERWQGHTSHADTEARVLREWLAVERDRVDATLERALAASASTGVR